MLLLPPPNTLDLERLPEINLLPYKKPTCCLKTSRRSLLTGERVKKFIQDNITSHFIPTPPPLPHFRQLTPPSFIKASSWPVSATSSLIQRKALNFLAVLKSAFELKTSNHLLENQLRYNLNTAELNLYNVLLYILSCVKS